MPSGWGIYYVVFLSAVLALGIPGFLYLISAFARDESEPARKRSAKAHGSQGDHFGSAKATVVDRTRLGRRVNARFFLASNAALVLITCGLLLVPCVGLIRGSEPGPEGLLSLILILSLCGFAFLALLYASRKGDLEWLETYREREEGDS